MNVKDDAERFLDAVQASQVAAEERKAKTWIARHPGWTLAIGIVLLAADIYQALKHL